MSLHLPSLLIEKLETRFIGFLLVTGPGVVIERTVPIKIGSKPTLTPEIPSGRVVCTIAIKSTIGRPTQGGGKKLGVNHVDSYKSSHSFL